MKKKKWFREYGWIYLPESFPGYLITALIILFNITVFIAVNRGSHSISDTLYGIFPYFVPSMGMLLWIGSESSKSRK